MLAKYAGGAIGHHSRGIKGQARSWAKTGWRTDDGTIHDAPVAGAEVVPNGAPLYILQLTRAPAVILEPFFGDHPADAEAATAARDSGKLPSHLVIGFGQLLSQLLFRRR